MDTTVEPTAPTDAASPADLPLERLEAELCSWSANLAAAEYRWFELLAEFDRREGWQQWECPSCVYWMCWQLGLDSRTAREKLRVAKSLATLPLVSAQMRLGRLSYSKVRAITRIAEPANEAGLVEIALAGTTSQVERVVSAYRRALPPADDQASEEARWNARALHHRRHVDGTITITATLPAPQAMEVLSAIDHFAPTDRADLDGQWQSPAARQVDGLVALAGAALAATDEQMAGGRPRYLVHLHTGEDRCEVHPEGAHDDTVVGAATATAERLACDAAVETITHDADGAVTEVSKRGSVIRGRLRRFVQQRDGSCQVPGCTHRARKEIHHLHHRGHGGSDDPQNLVLVCAYHHHRLHEGGWRARRLDDGTVEFIFPDGRAIPTSVPQPHGDPAAVADQGRRAEDGRCGWVGDRLDLDWTLATLFSQTPWHDPWHPAWQQPEQRPAAAGRTPGDAPPTDSGG